MQKVAGLIDFPCSFAPFLSILGLACACQQRLLLGAMGHVCKHRRPTSMPSKGMRRWPGSMYFSLNQQGWSNLLLWFSRM